MGCDFAEASLIRGGYYRDGVHFRSCMAPTGNGELGERECPAVSELLAAGSRDLSSSLQSVERFYIIYTDKVSISCGKSEL